MRLDISRNDSNKSLLKKKGEGLVSLFNIYSSDLS